MKKIYPIRLEEETIDDLTDRAERRGLKPTSFARSIIESYLRVLSPETIRKVSSHIRGDASGLKKL